ncbi:MAG TPA: DNA gyrase subunit A [Fusobacteria bacterium]|nr:DNA gyrase subunit A [Fusobacteriota bacterium]
MSEDIKVFIENEIKKSYLDYSMSVIVGRALPDIRDGLKPVHRRILFSMNENGMNYNRPYKKSARVVGDVLAKYHPHGDQAVYNSMVRMAQNFNTRHLLIDGQGNFGSVDGDSAASLRYTEVRMTKITNELIVDIDKNTVPFRKNFDETLYEPEVLPAKVPNLLLNGSSGIAVGMATNIPPHNLSEVIDATLAYIDNMEITALELMEYVKGPDFPTAGIVYGKQGLIDTYTKGRGKMKVRGRAHIEESKSGVESIIITELPYQVNKSKLVEQIADLAREKKLEGISDLRDESDRNGIRIYIEVKKGEDADIVLNKIYKFTNLEVTFGAIMLALDKNIPKVLNLKEIIGLHTSHRFEVVTRRTQFELDKAERRYHILLGFKIAISNIDEVVRIIKSSKDVKEAHGTLMVRFDLSEVQAKAILEMRLQKLTSLEVEKLDEEIASLEESIKELKAILQDESRIYDIIKKELREIKDNYGDKRRSEIVGDIDNISIEDMISDDHVLITITNRGYVKRINLDNYKTQNRGGKGYIGQNLSDEDFLRSATYAKNLDTLLLFTNRGKVYSIKVYDIPELSRSSKGRLFSNIVPLSVGERVKSIIKTRDMSEDKNLIFVTTAGIVKKTSLNLFKNINKSGIIAIKLRPSDDLINTLLVNEDDNILMATRNGYSIRFKSADVRGSGRNSFGVKGINLRSEDKVVAGVAVSSPETQVLTISEKGYGKKSKISNYRIISRGGKGVINMRVTEKTGRVITTEDVSPEDEVILITSKGSIIRTISKNISTTGRATQGVRIMKLREEETVVDMAKLRI